MNRSRVPKSLGLSSEQFDAAFERGFGLMAFVLNRHIMNHMRRICVELDMDPETALTWGTLAHMNNLPHLPLNADPIDVLNEVGMKRDAALQPIRLAQLAQITGLPRETVRRKLERLRALGKVDRDESGGWFYVRSGIGASEREFTQRTLIDFLQTTESLRALFDRLQDAQGSAGA